MIKVCSECGSRLNLDKVEKDVKDTFTRLKRVYIENLDFEKLIKKYDKSHTVFYCDPPYIDSRKYVVDFTNEDHIRLAEILKNIQGKFLLSINNHELAYELYKDFNIVDLKHNYSMRKLEHNTDCKELLITNY